MIYEVSRSTTELKSAHRLTKVFLLILGFGLSFNPIFAQLNRFELVDSLISAHVFPVAIPLKARFLPKSDQSHKYPRLYEHHLASSDEIDTTSYILDQNLSIDLLNEPDSIKSDFDGTGLVVLPMVHLAYFYSEITRRKGSPYYHFRVHHYVKNSGLENWGLRDYAIDLKVLDSNLIAVRSARFSKTKSSSTFNEGWMSTAMTSMNYYSAYDRRFNLKEKVFQWSHTNPNLYQYIIDVLNDKLEPYQSFKESVGFRYLSETEEVIHINGKKALFKAALIEEEENPAKEYLVDLKIHNFNTIILKGKANETVFDQCDSLGIYVVQEVRLSSFSSISELLNYFIMVKDHPSFVAWKNVDYDLNSVDILQRLDESRIFVGSRHNIQFRVKENWYNSTADLRNRIKSEFQVFDFYYDLSTNIVKIDQNENLACDDVLDLHWRFSNEQYDEALSEGVIELVELDMKDASEFTLPTVKIDTSSTIDFFDFKLVVSEDTGIYKKGDVVALSKFRLVEKKNGSELEQIF